MFKITFYIDLPENFNFKTDELPEKLTMISRQNSYIIKPENRYLYCDCRKIPYRRNSGNPEKLITVFGKFVDRLYSQLVEDFNGGNIHEDYKSLVERKI